MILSGEKKEEYRELKPYWLSRLCNFSVSDIEQFANKGTILEYKKFDAVRFFNGCAPSQKFPNFLIELKSIHIGLQKPGWGCMEFDESVFVLTLGEKIKTA